MTQETENRNTSVQHETQRPQKQDMEDTLHTQRFVIYIERERESFT